MAFDLSFKKKSTGGQVPVSEDDPLPVAAVLNGDVIVSFPEDAQGNLKVSLYDSAGNPIALNDTVPVSLLNTDPGVVAIVAALTSIDGHVDGLEGFTDGIEALITSTNGFVDGIESLLTTLGTYTDGLETLLTSLNSQFSSELYYPNAASFTRPADTTAYTGATSTSAGDLIGNSTTAGSVNAMSFAVPSITGSGNAQGVIAECELKIDAAVTATIRAHFYRTTAPTFTNGDNGVCAVSNYDADKYLGFRDILLTPSPNGGASGFDDGMRIEYAKATADNIYLVPEVISAYTPTNGGTIRGKIGVRRTL